MFVAGGALGGFLAMNFLGGDQAVNLSEETLSYLENRGILSAGEAYQPAELFSFGADGYTPWLFTILGGFLVGFGTRYAGGCTSGHAISGLSNLQLPSLIAVIGFFIGGLTFTWFILPEILN
jgi:uncharacterized membrane protein YedE/YeeE